MTPFCSILIPSYNRAPILRDCLRVLYSNAGNVSEFEALVRATEGDTETQAMSLARHTVTGPRLNGYNSLCHYHNELAEVSTGEWLWQWNDDVMMLTLLWDELVRDQCTDENAIYQPEIHKLNDSTYHCDAHCPFMLMHRKHWHQMVTECDFSYYKYASDVMCFDFAARHMMPTKFIKGLAVHHLRSEDAGK